jgi:hypothetical protein
MRVSIVRPFYEGGSTLATTGVSEKGRRLPVQPMSSGCMLLIYIVSI